MQGTGWMALAGHPEISAEAYPDPYMSLSKAIL